MQISVTKQNTQYFTGFFRQKSNEDYDRDFLRIQFRLLFEIGVEWAVTLSQIPLRKAVCLEGGKALRRAGIGILVILPNDSQTGFKALRVVDFVRRFRDWLVRHRILQVEEQFLSQKLHLLGVFRFQLLFDHLIEARIKNAFLHQIIFFLIQIFRQLSSERILAFLRLSHFLQLLIGHLRVLLVRVRDNINRHFSSLFAQHFEIGFHAVNARAGFQLKIKRKDLPTF